MAFRVKNISSLSSNQEDIFGGPPPWLDSLPPLAGMSEEIIDSKPFHLGQHRPPFGGPPPWLDFLVQYEIFC